MHVSSSDLAERFFSIKLILPKCYEVLGPPRPLETDIEALEAVKTLGVRMTRVIDCPKITNRAYGPVGRIPSVLQIIGDLQSLASTIAI